MQTAIRIHSPPVISQGYNPSQRIPMIHCTGDWLRNRSTEHGSTCSEWKTVVPSQPAKIMPEPVSISKLKGWQNKGGCQHIKPYTPHFVIRVQRELTPGFKAGAATPRINYCVFTFQTISRTPDKVAFLIACKPSMSYQELPSCRCVINISTSHHANYSLAVTHPESKLMLRYGGKPSQ